MTPTAFLSLLSAGQSHLYAGVALLHPDDRQVPSRISFQWQFIWIVLFFASRPEMLSHNVVFRRPAIVTLALQPFLPNGVVGYFIDLDVNHAFDILRLQIDEPARGISMRFAWTSAGLGAAVTRKICKMSSATSCTMPCGIGGVVTLARVLRAYVDGRQLQFAVSAVIKALFPELESAVRVYTFGPRVARDRGMENFMAEAAIPPGRRPGCKIASLG